MLSFTNSHFDTNIWPKKHFKKLWTPNCISYSWFECFSIVRAKRQNKLRVTTFIFFFSKKSSILVFIFILRVPIPPAHSSAFHFNLPLMIFVQSDLCLHSVITPRLSISAPIGNQCSIRRRRPCLLWSAPTSLVVRGITLMAHARTPSSGAIEFLNDRTRPRTA